MSLVVRQCTKCGHVETRTHWDSMSEAAKAEATEVSWACPECGWPEPQLIEIRSFDDIEAGRLVGAKRDDSSL